MWLWPEQISPEALVVLSTEAAGQHEQEVSTRVQMKAAAELSQVESSISILSAEHSQGMNVRSDWYKIKPKETD